MPSFSTSPVDGTHLFDDFHANTAVSDGLVGNLDWDMTTIANASTASWIASPNGVMRITSQGTSGDGESFAIAEDTLVLTGTNQVLRIRVRLITTVGTNNFRIGFHDVVTAGEPTVGIWLDCAAGVLSFDGASTNGDLTKAVTGAPTLTSGTTLVADTWHDLELRMSGENANGGPATISCFVDGFAAGQITGFLLGSAETMDFSIVHWTSSANARIMEIDYYEAYLPRN